MRRTLRIAAVVILTCLAVLLMSNLSLGNKQVDVIPQHRYAVQDPQFLASISASLGAGVVEGNAVEELLNGSQIFPAMLQAIRDASGTITLESYIFWPGSVGEAFAEALAERARHGVKVHVLLDWVGTRVEDALLERLRQSGVELRLYNAPRWHNLHRLNNRTHRKLLVVDGRVGFIGGVGIANAWRGKGRSDGQWRDTHFRVEGPVVAQLQGAFTDNWLQTTGDVLHGTAYFPPAAQAGRAAAHVFTSAPGGGAESMQLMYLLSIAAARRSIDLSAAYFIPDETAVDALVAALQRGVRVRIILPGRNMDFALVRRASRATWGRLLAAGARIHEYEPSMFHCKVLIVDGHWVSAGSSNFDNRSFSTNDEANINVYDEQFAARQTAVFEGDLKYSRRISLAEWERRGWADRLLDQLSSALSSQL